MKNPALIVLVKTEDKILEVFLTKEERAGIYELLTKYKKLELVDRDLKGMVLEDFTNNKK